MKPIEPGCLAIVVSSKTAKNIGKTVRVVEKAPKGIRVYLPNKRSVYPTTDGWVVETLDGKEELITLGLYTNLKHLVYTMVFRNSSLMRIGDDSVQDVLKKVVENVE